MFLARKTELADLNKLYEKSGFQLIIIYGRRKVGKTFLIKEFCKDKPTIFFVPEEHNETLALNSFSKLIYKHFNVKENESIIDSWEAAFNTIVNKSNNNKLVIVLDEFPYISKENPSLPSIIQKIIDHNLRSSQIFLIISGSSSSLIETQILSSKSPLYGMRSAQFKIESFDFYDSSLFFPSRSFYEKILYYSTLGGIPQYLIQFSSIKDYEHNMIENVLKRTSYLYDEPENFLRNQLSNPQLAGYILSLLSKGSFNIDTLKKDKIRNTLEFDNIVNKLLELSIISKKNSIGRSITKPKSFYKLNDNFFRFWYRFIYKNKSLIEMGMINYIYQNKITLDLNSHIGYVFEDICIQFLKKMNFQYKLPFTFENIGSWLGFNPIKKKQAQIDIVAVNDENVLIGECKWNSEPINLDILNGLIDKGELLKYSSKYYCLFSKSGFTKEVVNKSKDHSNILLFDLEALDI